MATAGSVRPQLSQNSIWIGPAQLVGEQGRLNLSLLDREVSDRFFREFQDYPALPALIPLLWRNLTLRKAAARLHSLILKHPIEPEPGGNSCDRRHH